MDFSSSGPRRCLALTARSSAGQPVRQTGRLGGWERLVCRLVWTARLRYQVAVLWAGVGGGGRVPHSRSAAVPQTVDTTPWEKNIAALTPAFLYCRTGRA